MKKVYLVKIIKKSNLAHLKVNAFLSMVTWQQFIDQKNCEKSNQTICDIKQHSYLWIDVMQKNSLEFYLIILCISQMSTLILQYWKHKNCKY